MEKLRTLLPLVAALTVPWGCGPETSTVATTKTDARTFGASDLQVDELRDDEIGCYGIHFGLDHAGCDEVLNHNKEAPVTDEEIEAEDDETTQINPTPTPPAPTPEPDSETVEEPVATPLPLDPAAGGDPNVVVFRIASGTADGSWNTEATMVTAKVGQIIRFVNDDSVRHRLHTNGSPCPHGTNFAPGATFDCVTTRTFDATVQGPLYDHNEGQSAEVWIKVTANDAGNFSLTDGAQGAAENCSEH